VWVGFEFDFYFIFYFNFGIISELKFELFFLKKVLTLSNTHRQIFFSAEFNPAGVSSPQRGADSTSDKYTSSESEIKLFSRRKEKFIFEFLKFPS